MKLYKLKLNDPMPSVLSCFLNDQTCASSHLTHLIFYFSITVKVGKKYKFEAIRSQTRRQPKYRVNTESGKGQKW